MHLQLKVITITLETTNNNIRHWDKLITISQFKHVLTISSVSKWITSMSKPISNHEHYSHGQTVPSHNRCQSDHDNDTDDQAGCDHVHDMWQHASDVCQYESSYAAYNRTATNYSPRMYLRKIMHLLYGPKNGLRAFGYNYTKSEPIWIKFWTMWAKYWGLALADFGRDLRSSNSLKGSQNIGFFVR